MEKNKLATQEMTIQNIEDYAMTAEVAKKQVQTVQKIMKAVMKNDVHYGKIPGCGKGKVLLKAGAEKLVLAFRFSTDFEIETVAMPGGHREYSITCNIKSIATGVFIGQGVGCCSTMETKFRFRKAEQTCPECGEAAIIKGKQQYGGGWLCFKAKGGCGAKFKDGDETIENQEMGRIEHDNPADYYNTVKKMAKKRALVDAVLSATGASDIFEQDLEELPEDELPTIPKDKEPEGSKNNQPGKTGDTVPAKEGQLKTIRKQLEKKGLDDKYITEQMDIPNLEDLQSHKVNEALQLITDFEVPSA